MDSSPPFGPSLSLDRLFRFTEMVNRQHMDSYEKHWTCFVISLYRLSHTGLLSDDELRTLLADAQRLLFRSFEGIKTELTNLQLSATSSAQKALDNQMSKLNSSATCPQTNSPPTKP